MNAIPPEIHQHILLQLSIIGLLTMAQVNFYFNELCNDERLWMLKVKSDYEIIDYHGNWKQLCITLRHNECQLIPVLTLVIMKHMSVHSDMVAILTNIKSHDHVGKKKFIYLGAVNLCEIGDLYTITAIGNNGDSFISHDNLKYVTVNEIDILELLIKNGIEKEYKSDNYTKTQNLIIKIATKIES